MDPGTGGKGQGWRVEVWTRHLAEEGLGSCSLVGSPDDAYRHTDHGSHPERKKNRIQVLLVSLLCRLICIEGHCFR